MESYHQPQSQIPSYEKKSKSWKRYLMHIPCLNIFHLVIYQKVYNCVSFWKYEQHITQQQYINLHKITLSQLLVRNEFFLTTRDFYFHFSLHIVAYTLNQSTHIHTHKHETHRENPNLWTKWKWCVDTLTQKNIKKNG